MRAKRSAPGKYLLGEEWELTNVRENPMKSRWILKKIGEEKEYEFAMKRKAIEYVEVMSKSVDRPVMKKASGAMTKEEMANFDFSDPESYWPDPN